jgi:arylsulfatase A-like enzyme
MYKIRGLFLLVAVLLGVLLMQYKASPVEAAPRPNIIIIIADDQDATSLPIMRKLMANPGGKWFRFTNAFAGEGIGLPARASILSGQHPNYHRVVGNKQGHRFNDRETLAVWLDREGYYTMMAGKYMNFFPFGRGPHYVPRGWDSFSQYFAAEKDPEKLIAAVNDELEEVIDTRSEPFFLWFGLRSPQRPADPPARYENVDVFSVVQKATLRPNFNEEDMSDKPKAYARQPKLRPGGYSHNVNGYPGYMWDTRWIEDEQKRSLQQLMAIDDGLMDMLALLEEKDELDNTLIFYLSDTGYSWGAHRRTGRDCPHEECILLPFMVFYPYTIASNTNQPRVISRLIANVDITATIVELTDIAPTRRPQVGESLVPLLEATNPNAAQWEDVVLLSNLRSPRYWGLRTPDWKYVEYASGERELYDLRDDPYEMENRAWDANYAVERAELAALLKIVRAQN